MTIFDLMQSSELVAYWEELLQDEAPYPCEELFPADKKRGLDLKWLKGAKGLPVVLKTSAVGDVIYPAEEIFSGTAYEVDTWCKQHKDDPFFSDKYTSKYTVCHR